MPNPSSFPLKAMILAAGYGTRMRPITDSVPKPLISVNGRTIIDRTIDHLGTAGINQFVINTHHLGQQIIDHFDRSGFDISFSPETTLLETGGGIQNALPLLGLHPFISINGDAVWVDGPQNTITRLVKNWDAEKMDVLLLLHPTDKAHGYEGRGDFFTDNENRLSWRGDEPTAPWIYTGIQILHPRLFHEAPGGAYSLVTLYDKALRAGRLFSIPHDGEWFDVGNPQGLAEVEAYMKEKEER